MKKNQFTETVKNVLDLIIKHGTDETFLNDLIQTGTEVSYVAIAIKVLQKVLGEFKTPAQKAYSSLLSFILDCANYALLEKNLKFPDNYKLQKNEIMKLLGIFNDTSEWNSYLPDHPSIKKFSAKISEQLSNQGYDNMQINAFKEFFVSVLDNKAYGDPRIKEFFKWYSIDEQTTKLIKYLRDLIQQDYNGIDGKSILDYHIVNNAIWAGAETWQWNEETVIEESESNLHEVNTSANIISEFLTDENKWYVIIGAPFGIGKTSLVKISAHEYAKKYLGKTDSWIPVIVPLRKGFDNVYGQDELDFVLSNIISPNEQAHKRKILLFMDGLDEYPGNPDDFMKKIKELHGKQQPNYPNMKVIVTTRLRPNLKNIFHNENYVRLLSFTEPQVNEFFQKYGIGLKYKDCVGLGLHKEEVTKPLFSWILAFTHNEWKKAKFDDLSENASKSLLYIIFIHHLWLGKHIKTRERHQVDSKRYFDEKKILREIAALKQMDNEITTSEIEQEFSLRYKNSLENLDLGSVLTSYFYESNKKRGEIIDFVHTTFKEYLLAEYYIGALLSGESYKLNAGIPSKETVEFLDGLIDLLNVNHNYVKKLIYGDESSLLNSFDYSTDPKMTIAENAYKNFDDENTIYLNSAITNTGGKWKKIEINFANRQNLLIWRWLSLYILKKLQPNKEIDEKKLTNLIVASGDIDGYLKNLTSIKIANTNFARINLSEANLTNSILVNLDLRGANLPATDLSYANISNTNLIGSVLTAAKLIETNLTDTDLRISTCPKIILKDAVLTGADFSYANFMNAKIDCNKFQNLKCKGANFAGAKINKELAEYINKNGGINVNTHFGM